MSDPALIELYAEALSEARTAARALAEVPRPLSVEHPDLAEVRRALAPGAVFRERSLELIEGLRAALEKAREGEQVWLWDEGAGRSEPELSERGWALDRAARALARTHRAAAAALDRRQAVALASAAGAPDR